MNKTWATILMVFGFMASAGALGDGSYGGFIITMALGVTGVYFRNKAIAQELKEQKEKFFPIQPKFEINDDFIIRLARRLNNRLSVEDLITQTSLSRDDAKQHLEELSQKGFCEIRLTDVEKSGKIYYYFD